MRDLPQRLARKRSDGDDEFRLRQRFRGLGIALAPGLHAAKQDVSLLRDAQQIGGRQPRLADGSAACLAMGDGARDIRSSRVAAFAELTERGAREFGNRCRQSAQVRIGGMTHRQRAEPHGPLRAIGECGGNSLVSVLDTRVARDGGEMLRNRFARDLGGRGENRGEIGNLPSGPGHQLGGHWKQIGEVCRIQ